MTEQSAGKKITVPVIINDLGFGNALLAIAMDDIACALIFSPSGGSSHSIEKVSYRYRPGKLTQEQTDLVLTSFGLIETKSGDKLPAQVFEIQIKIPLNQGLGDSTMLIVAAALAANSLLLNPFSVHELGRLLCEESTFLNTNPACKIQLLAALLGGVQWMVDPAKGIAQRIFYPPGLFFNIFTSEKEVGIGRKIPGYESYALGCLLYGFLQTNLNLIRISFKAIFDMNQEFLPEGYEQDILGVAYNNPQATCGIIIWGKSDPAAVYVDRSLTLYSYNKMMQIAPVGAVLV